MYSTLTSKGQITIPREIRDQLQLKTGDRVEFIFGDNGRVELLPATASITELKGMLPAPRKPVSVEEMNQSNRGLLPA